MNLKTCLQGWLRGGRSLALLVFVTPSAAAVTQEIRALFIPDSAYPQRNTFTNTTPVSGYCEHYPGVCRDNNIFSIRLPIRFESVKAMQPNADVRNSAMFKLPTQWRSLTVTNVDTKESEQVEVRVAGFGSTHVLSDTSMNLTGAPTAREGHDLLWVGAGWIFPAPPCQYSGMVLYSSTTYNFFWKTPTEGACVKVASFPIPGMSYNYLDFAYELRTPNPMGMSTGLYTGSLNYSVGPGGDFDMGDVMLPNDNQLTLDFVLDVQHMLKVEIPPGGEKVRLVPDGGWQNWLQAGRRPVRLFRDQMFHISASSRFKVELDCVIEDYDCTIKDEVTNRVVKLKTYLSLPPGMTNNAGNSVRYEYLRAGPSYAKHFKTGHYVHRGPGVLHFEIASSEMAQMLQPGVASSYVGNVTVIWDSDV